MTKLDKTKRKKQICKDRSRTFSLVKTVVMMMLFLAKSLYIDLSEKCQEIPYKNKFQVRFEKPLEAPLEAKSIAGMAGMAGMVCSVGRMRVRASFSRSFLGGTHAGQGRYGRQGAG